MSLEVGAIARPLEVGTRAKRMEQVDQAYKNGDRWRLLVELQGG